MKETVPAALDGQRVDRIVSMLTGLSRTEAAALVASGGVRVDGRPVAGKLRVLEGQELDIDEPEAVGTARLEPDASVDVPVVHVDDDVIVVDKPEGLVVHPGSGHEAGTLVHGLLARYPELREVGDPQRPGIVHRLDKGTTGLLVVARTPDAYDDLVEQLSSRSVERRYVALVWGWPEAASGVIDAPIGRSPRDPTRMAVVADGREARTRYEVSRQFESPVRCALADCGLETGRTHQIRVHLSAIGHPVVGDAQYRGRREGLSASRPMLHAARLSFDHPGTGERVSFESPMPADMAALIATLS
jgi:23S rRNA pseudouridine1911/1915/1917 synthase